MEKKSETKLRLNMETVKSLTADQLGGVTGGSDFTSLPCPSTYVCTSGCTIACPSGSGSGGGSMNCDWPQ